MGEARLGRPATMTCDLTSRLDDEWMLEEAQPETRELLGSKVVRVEHVGTYACRTVAGRSSLSQHAFANAIDIAGMTLADGTRLTIGGDRPDTGRAARSCAASGAPPRRRSAWP
ncbi:MAG TPA: extensin family protein [Alphaproteobacteria bacterium]